MIDLITGHQGVPHISAEQVSTIQNALMYGYGQDQIVRIKDGGISKDGLEILIAAGYWRANGHDIQITEDDSVILDPTSEDMSRIDVVYAELLQDIPSGVQRVELVVVQGTEAETPTEPPVPVAPQLTTDLLLLAVPVVKATVTEGAMTIVDQTLPMQQQMSGISVKFGYCYTDKAEAAKVVTTADQDFELEIGNIVYVNFADENTAASPTLNVDGTGALGIKAYGMTDPDLWWQAGDIVGFVYYGFYFMMLPSSGQISALFDDITDIYSKVDLTARYGTCGTSQGTAAKVVTTLNGDFELKTGARVLVKFDSQNTASSPTLNVDSTGAKQIRGLANGSIIPLRWEAKDLVEFVYTGTDFVMMPSSGQIYTLKNSITSVGVFGSTNTLSGTITKGTYFYRGADLFIATADIPVNAAISPPDNCSPASGGGLNHLNAALSNKVDSSKIKTGRMNYLHNAMQVEVSIIFDEPFTDNNYSFSAILKQSVGRSHSIQITSNDASRVNLAIYCPTSANFYADIVWIAIHD